MSLPWWRADRGRCRGVVALAGPLRAKFVLSMGKLGPPLEGGFKFADAGPLKAKLCPYRPRKGKRPHGTDPHQGRPPRRHQWNPSRILADRPPEGLTGACINRA